LGLSRPGGFALLGTTNIERIGNPKPSGYPSLLTKQYALGVLGFRLSDYRWETKFFHMDILKMALFMENLIY